MSAGRESKGGVRPRKEGGSAKEQERREKGSTSKKTEKDLKKKVFCF
jgi:hypothetical protein